MKKKSKIVFEYACIVVLAFLMALSYEIFIFQNSFAPSGINGIATMIQHIFDFSVGYISLIINIPLATLAFFLVDRKFALRSGVFVLVFSVLLIAVQNMDFLDKFVYTTSIDDGRNGEKKRINKKTIDL